MKKNFKKMITLLLCVLMAVSMLFGCGAKKAETVTVTFMNGDELLGEVEVEVGAVLDPESYSAFENLEDYSFSGWYETPTYLEASLFDLTTATFEENTVLYGLFTSANITEDTREWYIVGSSSKGSLGTTNWAADIQPNDRVPFMLEKAEDSNTFTITLDLYAGDQFQLVVDWSWDEQKGWGYVSEYDESQVENGGGLSGSDKTSNINVLVDGNYTITLVTNPDDPAQDYISIVRNGDAAAADEVEEEPYVFSESTVVKVKGSWVEDWSEYKELTAVSDGVYTIEMELTAGTELYFSIFDGDTDTGLGLKAENVKDDASLALLEDSDNVKVAADGTYTFTIDLNDNTITVTQ